MEQHVINVISQVCTLRQAMKLARMGVLQTSLLYHHKSAALSGDGWAVGTRSDITTLFSTEIFSAYTTAELGAMLQSETGFCYFHGRSGMWTHKHVHEKEKLFPTQAQCYASRLIWRMGIEPLKWNTEFVNQRLRKFLGEDEHIKFSKLTS